MKCSIVCSEVRKIWLPCRPEPKHPTSLCLTSPAGKDGGSFSLQAALQNGPVLAAFFKVPVLPASTRSRFWNASTKRTGHENHDRRHLAGQPARHCAFLKEYGVTFRTQLDDPNGYAVSNAYGLTNVPSLS